MDLPTSVQKASDYAEAIEKAMHAEVVPANGAPAPAADDKPAAKPEDAKAPEPVQEKSNQDVSGSESNADEIEKLRNRYASLRGKYDAEVPRLHQQLKDTDSRMRQLLAENQSLRKEIAEKEQSKSYITDEDKETYGEDMVDLVRRGAREEGAKYAAEAAKLKAEVDSLREQVRVRDADAQASRVENFYRTLTVECPDWEAQNTDKGFLEWLNEADPVYGFQRNEALQRAFNALDPHRVSAIFNQYRQSKRTENPLAKQVSPSRHSASVNPQPAPRHWSQADIAKFYEAWTRNEISDDEAHKIEQEIADAVASQRIDP
jgi:hypothetical protein